MRGSRRAPTRSRRRARRATWYSLIWMIRRATAAKARPPAPELIPEDLTDLERKYLNGEANPAEGDAAFESLARRALASPDGYVTVCGVPDDDDP